MHRRAILTVLAAAAAAPAAAGVPTTPLERICAALAQFFADGTNPGSSNYRDAQTWAEALYSGSDNDLCEQLRQEIGSFSLEPRS